MSDKDDLTDASNYSGWEDEVCQSAKCLFCPEEIEVGQEYGKHLIAEHSFDLKTIISERKLDVHQVISLINYTRSIEIEKGAGYIDPERLKDNLYHSEDFKSSILSSGKYLKPVLKEDHVLYTVDEFIDLNSDCEEVNPTVTEGQPILRERESNTDLKLELSKIKIELRKCREFVKNLISGPADCADNRVTAPGNDESYFRLYEDLSIHDTMLKDKVRTGAYGKFVEGASNIFQGKTVLDVGCGTSILSLFCARSGSKRVYSVDNARLMMNVARQIVRDNCYENVIVFIEDIVENIKLPEKVDIIISEWMGYFLLFEKMLDSLIEARDKFLKHGGLSRDMKWHDSKSKFWMDVYGFNMSAMRPLVFKEISIENANPSTLVSKAYLIREFDISTIQIQDTNFKSTVVIVPDSPGPITALCGWFDVIFDAPGAPTVTLSTSPESEPTHWHQSIMGLDRVIYLDEGDTLACDITIKGCRSTTRDLTVDIHVKVLNGVNELKDEIRMNYMLK